jgi:REP element-mobilizing transposase RayT
MGRPPRRHFSGAVYHFLARGNNRQPIYLNPADRRAFEGFLHEGIERFQYRCHAFCWMTNHFHMAVEVASVPLSHIAHNLLFRYARWFHWKHGRSGHLFERRYKAFLVHSDQKLQQLIRYIHLNPVRAGLADRPEDYRWSSYAAYIAKRAAPPWLTRDHTLSLFGESAIKARAELRTFTEREDDSSEAASGTRKVEHASSEEPAQPLAENSASSGLPLFGPELTLDQLLLAVSTACGIEPSDIRVDVQRRSIVRARALAAYFARERTDWTLMQLAGALGRDATTLSRAATQITRRLAKEPELRTALKRIEDQLA